MCLLNGKKEPTEVERPSTTPNPLLKKDKFIGAQYLAQPTYM